MVDINFYVNYININEENINVDLQEFLIDDVMISYLCTIDQKVQLTPLF